LAVFDLQGKALISIDPRAEGKLEGLSRVGEKGTIENSSLRKKPQRTRENRTDAGERKRQGNQSDERKKRHFFAEKGTSEKRGGGAVREKGLENSCRERDRFPEG